MTEDDTLKALELKTREFLELCSEVEDLIKKKN